MKEDLSEDTEAPPKICIFPSLKVGVLLSLSETHYPIKFGRKSVETEKNAIFPVNRHITQER